MNDIICKELIVSTLTTKGNGTHGSPYRRVTQVFEKDGTLVAENDPHKEGFSGQDVIDFFAWVKVNAPDTIKPSVLMLQEWHNSKNQ